MSSWKANFSRWSVTISRVAVMQSSFRGTSGRAWRRSPTRVVIPSQIIGITGRCVNDARLARRETPWPGLYDGPTEDVETA